MPNLTHGFSHPGEHFFSLVVQVYDAVNFYQEIGIDGIVRSKKTTESSGRQFPTLESVYDMLKGCQRCKLHNGKTHLVFGAGNPNADLVFIGEAPGFYEDQQGQPFVGQAGELLTRIIHAIRLRREDVYITNIMKCRPPHNRDPEPDEIAMCEPFLRQQLTIIQPKIICALGKFAAQTLLKVTTPISKLRGRFYDYHGIKLMPTYHPAYLLRHPGDKGLVWQDMQMIQKAYNAIKHGEASVVAE